MFEKVILLSVLGICWFILILFLINKGDKKRPADTEEFNSSWDRIFGKKKVKKVSRKNTNVHAYGKPSSAKFR